MALQFSGASFELVQIATGARRNRTLLPKPQLVNSMQGL